MAFKILTENSVDNTNIDGARAEHFNAGLRDGIVKGAFNEGIFSALASNVISFDTCELRISGHRIINDEMWTQTFSSSPSVATRYALVGQIVVDSSSNVVFSLLVQNANTQLVKDNLFRTENGAGTYQVEIGRFTLTTNGTIADVVRTLDLITGGSSGMGEHFISGDITTTILDAGMDANVTSVDIYDANGDYKQTNFSFEFPATAGTVVKVNNIEQANLDFLSDPQTQINNLSTTVNNKMDKTNPNGTGSFSLNRDEEITLGDMAVAVGDETGASGEGAFANGMGTHAQGKYSHSEGETTLASGRGSHSDGTLTAASGDYSNVWGVGTLAHSYAQTAFGTYNIRDNNDKYAEIVGNGNDNNTRSNARELEWNGNERIAGRHQADGGYTDGNNANYSAKLPDTTGWTSNKTIAMTDLLPVGSLVACIRTTVPTGWLWCNGSTFNQADYPELYSVLGTNVLPDMNHCFPEGTSTASEIYSGTNTQPIAAGLPDITGQFDCNARDGTINNTGAFGKESSGSNQVSNATNIKGKVTVSFKASDGETHSGTYRNDIYGKSDTVQPKSYRFMYLIKAV